MTARGKKPPPGVVTRLWALAAGRCEFRGCNKLLLRDALSGEQANLALVSHIVAASPDGPRGHPVRSPALCQRIDNLMLTCRDHGKVIDDSTLVAKYPEELLLQFKREHEERIRRLTAIGPDAKSRLLLFRAPINGGIVSPLSEADVSQAILPRYRADEQAFEIDLNAFGAGLSNPATLRIAAGQLKEQLRELARLQHSKPAHLSAFALAPIPLLVLLGRELGDLGRLDAYQFHRSAGSWVWPQEEKPKAFYKILGPRAAAQSEAVVLLSVSGSVDRQAWPKGPSKDAPVYEIRARRRGLDFLKSKARLDAFSLTARELMQRLHDAKVASVHVLAAVPSPIAIEFGRATRKMHGALVVYEYDEVSRLYGGPLEIVP